MERCCGAEVWSWVSKMCRMHAADMVALSAWSHHKHQCRLLWGSAQVERSNGAVLRSLGMVLGVQNVHNACNRQCCVEHMAASQASW